MGKLQNTTCKANIFDSDLNHKYLHFRRTKIVATLGPASSSLASIKGLIKRGLDVVRINFSHGTIEQHLQTIQTVREASVAMKKEVAILGDLCGPKIRVGKFKGGSVLLKDGQVVTLTVKAVLGEDGLIPCQYKGLVKEAQPGHQVLLDDGNLELKITEKKGDVLIAKVICGGILKDHKGLNLPDTAMSVPALTAKDRQDALACIKADVDYLALSFVRKPQDVMALKRIIQSHNSKISIIAKIEKPEALANIEGILEVSDGIMVARGDLGVEMAAKKVPFIQQTLIKACIEHKKPVIVATQMLESMIEHARPTRAEVTDVSSACLAGADAVMLSAETASGKHPMEALQSMDEILREAEAYQFFSLGGRFGEPSWDRHLDCVQDAINVAISQLSRDLHVKCIVVATRDGNTARNVAASRPAAPVLALTHNRTTLRKLQLVWGAVPMLVDEGLDARQSLSIAQRFMTSQGLASKGDHLLLVAGRGSMANETNSIALYEIE